MYGSFIADEVKLNSNAVIHYDEALANIDIIGGGSISYVVKSWQEKY